ncbi:16S rRNA (cytosine(967)-C(5))-methyltransferase RsmB [Bacillus sp. FJAT-44742]|uniref:16S rRNA (cytosine(967)-C(5))-methyltransferase RsmB n=1 Tax=Bacillus sp. FJAT-44742 TaxID=2014005 RepID=UPI000C24DD96|nr:16S rRNA (cytosine(967)-C(5))-methyltransferase RsmB [Bacillus sp. FJAT-44742]
MTKADKNVREVALDLLMRIEKEGAYSNLALNQALKEKSVPGKDTALLTELVYGTLKRRATLDFYLSPFIKKGTNSLDLWVLSLLRLSLYQMVYLERIPERAIIHEAVNIAKKRGHRGIAGMVNGVLRSIQRKGLPDPSSIDNPRERISIETSHPEWLLSLWEKAYGREEAEAMARKNLEPAPVTVRVNVLKTNKMELMKRLEEEGCQVREGRLSEDAVEIISGKVMMTETFQEGWCTIQDESSMLVARALAPEKGMKVLDACAAPGGKTTHAAERMGDSGSITALDLHEKKINLINQQVQRLGITSVQSEALDARKLTEKFPEDSFDRVLVDAPCSGLGVIRRKPELKWEKSPEDIQRLPEVQKAILQEAGKVLKPGGRLVYSTCTVEANENEQVIKEFLEANPAFKFDETLIERLPERMKNNPAAGGGQITILPHHYGTDGFYICSLTKKDEERK